MIHIRLSEPLSWVDFSLKMEENNSLRILQMCVNVCVCHVCTHPHVHYKDTFHKMKEQN